MDNRDDVVEEFIKTTYDDSGEKKAKQGMDNLGSKAQEVGSKISTAFSAIKWNVLGNAIKKTTQKIAEFSKKSADYIETMNLLQVAFEGNTKEIKRFGGEISDILNLDDSTILSAAAHFKILTQSMGLATETGTKLAKLMTKMTLDVSSLYNMDFDKAQTALQYAMEGRGTSLKQRTGVSVLETSVQTTLDVLGIDAYVENMNDAEKAIARVISMEYQLMSSQGDLARTIEAPANQMRVMGEQIKLLARNIGNVFLPIVAKILPYLNAFLIVINAIISAIARLVGYKEDMFDTFDVSGGVDYFDDLSGAIDGVGRSAENAANKMKGLRGFDKLNVIKTPTSTGASIGGGAGVGGVNPSLLEALNKMTEEYNMKLDKVKTKASEIAEKILEWLGFSKEFNEETQKWEWVFKKITPGTVLGSLALGGVVVLGVVKILSTVKKIKSLFKGGGEIAKTAKDVESAGTSFTGFFDSLGKGVEAIAILGGFALVLQSVSDVMTTFSESGLTVNEVLGLMGTIVGSLVVLITALTVAAQFLQSPLAMAGLVLLVASISTTLLVIKETLPTILDALGKFIVEIGPTVNMLLETMGENLTKIIYALGTALPPILDSLGKTFEKIFGSIARIVETMGNTIVNVMNTSKNVIVVVLNTILDFINRLGPAVNNLVDNIIKAVTKVINFIVSGVEYLINTVIIDGLNGIIRIITGGSLGEAFADWFGFDLPRISHIEIARFQPRLYAQGGMPDVGQLFIANEKGAELVGHIGGQTFVANQNQMLDLIDKKLQNSGGIQNATFVVQVGDETIAKKVLKDLNGMAKSNGKPITITG